MTTALSSSPSAYYETPATVAPSGWGRKAISRLAFPLLSVLSREQSRRLGLIAIDDERVLMALKHVKGRLLDVGCGSNTLVRSYGNGVGVDVVAWEGCDRVIRSAAELPFEDGSFDTVSFLACLNHIPNRQAALADAHRVLAHDGQVLLTMIPPRVGQFVHWWRRHNDPDHSVRCIDHSQEVMGLKTADIHTMLTTAGFTNIRSRRFVFGVNQIFLADKA